MPSLTGDTYSERYLRRALSDAWPSRRLWHRCGIGDSCFLILLRPTLRQDERDGVRQLNRRRCKADPRRGSRCPSSRGVRPREFYPLRSAGDHLVQIRVSTSTRRIAAREAVSESYARHLVPLALLVPSIVELDSILSGGRECSPDLRSSCRNRSVLGRLAWFGNKRLGEELHVAHPMESKEAEVLTQFAPGAGEPGRRIKP